MSPKRKLTLCGVLVGLRQTPPIVPRALEDDYGPGGSVGESGEWCEYGEMGRQGEEDDDGDLSDGSGDENDDASTASQAATASVMGRGAVVRAGEVSTAAVPDGHGN